MPSLPVVWNIATSEQKPINNDMNESPGCGVAQARSEFSPLQLD